MKKATSVVLFFVLAFSAFVPAFAQKSRTIRSPQTVDFVQYERITSISDGKGVYLRWDVRSETSNLGFNVYRTGKSGPVLVNPSVILGAGVKSSRPTTFGEKYEFFDPQGKSGSSYIIRSLSSDGRQIDTSTGVPKFASNFEAATGRTKASFLNTSSIRGDIQKENLSLPTDLQTEVQAAVREPNLAGQRYVASQPGAKIAVKKDGIYSVSRAELQAAGFNVNSNSSNWRLFMEGNEQAIEIGGGDQFILFYGKGADTFETDTRTYYLISDGVAGKRMIRKILRPLGGNVVANNYRVTVDKEERNFYSPKIKNGQAENFFSSRLVSANPVDFTTDLTGVSTQLSDAVISLKMQGIFPGQHSINVAINGNLLGTITGIDLEGFSGEFTMPSSFLVEGTNTLTLNTTLSGDSALFDSLKVSYTRNYFSDQNKVAFYTPGYRKADLTGFSSSNINVYDTTFDGDTQLVLNPTIIQPAGGGYTVKLPADRAAVYYAVEDSALLQSPSVISNTPSSYSADTTLAEMVFISHSAPDFIEAANVWAAYRNSRTGGHFSVKVIDVADIFDEYSYGALNGAAINRFLQDAQDNWQSKYVLLLGDGSYDPRNYEGVGNFALIPTSVIDLIYEEAGSDDALSDFNHDGLADIPIGRISARTGQEITTAFNKTVAFEQPLMQSLNRGALFAYDMPSTYDFEAMSYSLALQLPAGTPTLFAPRGLPAPNQNTPDPEGQTRLINGLNTGPFIVNYSGHGSPGTWASINFFSNSNVEQLTNTNNVSIYTMLTCFNGYFLRPRVQDESLAERLIKSPSGGAVATWSSSTETTPDVQGVMGERFYNQVGIGNIKRIGDLIKDAKSTIAGSDVGYSWVLLGDPALQVRP